MGRTLYAFNDKLYEVEQTFTCMNQPQEFTITPGEYLFICNGGAGGGTNASSWWGYGASAYGVFETDQTETLYAVVGGNGVSWTTGNNAEPTPGGYNGGGRGGYNTDSPSSCPHGGSGGGASDIRLNLDDTLVPPVYENNLPEEYQEVAFLCTRWMDQGYINTGYLPRANSRYEMDAWFSEWASEKRGGWRIPFGSRSYDGSPDSFAFAIRNDSDMRIRVNVYGQWPYGPNNDVMMYDRDVHITYNDENHRAVWTDGIDTVTLTLPTTPTDSSYPLYLFTMNNWGSPGDYYCSGMKLYRFKIYESDVLVHDYIPCRRKSDNVTGLYDIIANTFIQSSGIIYARAKETVSRSLLSRILVAAGGGGDSKFSSNRDCPKLGYGGGKVGSCVAPRYGQYSHSQWVFPTQSDLNIDSDVKFGQGMNGKVHSGQWASYGAEGAGGGGGGWYGGVSEAGYTYCESVGGGGGSSYALTSDSWKPYGYVPTSHYYFKASALVPCQTTEGSILICKLTKILEAEDTIIVPLTGKETKVRLYPGTYNLKCWGAEGGMFVDNTNRSLGGYSEGTLELSVPHEVYGYVGGAGLFNQIRSLANQPDRYYNEQCAYNGGGMGIRIPQLYSASYTIFSGGGATDIRLTMDDTPVHPPIPDPEIRDDIPEEYTQLKAIFMGDSYINSGYKPKANTALKLDVSISTVSGSYRELFGSDPWINFYTVASGRAAFVINNDTTFGDRPPTDTRLTIETGKNWLTWRSSSASYTYTTNNVMSDCNVDLFFGTMNRSGGAVDYARATWYNIKIYESEILIHDFVPVIKNSNNKLGFYDVIGDAFIECLRSENTAVPLQTITYPSRSLMSRFIVAGGGGGQGYSSGIPGKGGGTTGGNFENGNGTNAGPGTQTSSPQSLYPEINGGFGYGGNGVVVNNGRGGAGGGGWFGGSGTYPNGSSDDDKGGSGGSGYVLTEDSYKPEYYIPTSEFYLSNASTTLGGNTLTPNMTKIEIDVIQAFCNKLLMYDMDGYKTYDEDQDKWVLFSQTINPSLIEEYGRYDIPNINGMLDEFQVVIDDPDNAISNIEVTSIPLPQSIVFLVPRRYSIGRSIIDAVYDTSVYDFSTNISIYDDQYNAYTVTIDKTQESDEVLKLYSIMLFSQ